MIGELSERVLIEKACRLPGIVRISLAVYRIVVRVAMAREVQSGLQVSVPENRTPTFPFFLLCPATRVMSHKPISSIILLEKSQPDAEHGNGWSGRSLSSLSGWRACTRISDFFKQYSGQEGACAWKAVVLR